MKEMESNAGFPTTPPIMAQAVAAENANTAETANHQSPLRPLPENGAASVTAALHPQGEARQRVISVRCPTQNGALTLLGVMRRIVVAPVTVAAATAASAVAVAAGHTVGPAARGAKPVVCDQGEKRAAIGGRVSCLRIGMRCGTRFNMTSPSYRTYGFLCSTWYSSAPTTLFRIALPGTAPTTCQGISPTPSSPHPGSQATWVGESPLWLGPYLDWRTDAEHGIWHYRYATGLRDGSGWGIKFLWQLLNSAGPTRISFTDLADAKLLTIILSGSYLERSTIPTLDPARPGHTDPLGQHPDASEWGSTVLFPHAGCYRLNAQWPQGSTDIVFSFGR